MATKAAAPAITTCLKLHNGVSMPQLGLGVWLSPSGDVTVNAVRSAIHDVGYRHIDTAAIYGNEESVGEGIQQSGIPRNELFITTKLWNDDQGYELTHKAFETSLKKLKLDYLDLYLIHWPRSQKYIDEHGAKFIDSWKAMEELYEQKKVRAIGVSNFLPKHLDLLFKNCKVKPMVNQIELSPWFNQAELRKYCAHHNIVVTAYSPLGHGNLINHPVLTQIGAKYNKTAAQTILRWDIQHNLITIPKSVHVERIKENANIFDFELTHEDMDAIDKLDENKRFCPHPDDATF